MDTVLQIFLMILLVFMISGIIIAVLFYIKKIWDKKNTFLYLSVVVIVPVISNLVFYLFWHDLFFDIYHDIIPLLPHIFVTAVISSAFTFLCCILHYKRQSDE